MTFPIAVALLGIGAASAVPPGYDTATITFPNEFRGAAALAFGTDGTLYVAEGKDFLDATNRSTIYAVGRDGVVLDTILLEGDDSAGGGNISIGGMAYHPLRDELLITDNAPGAGTLYSVSPTMKIATSHRSFVDLAQIDDVAVRATGEVVVTNAGLAGEVYQIDLDSTRVTRLAAQLETAAGVAFDFNGDLIYQQSVITSFDPFQSHGEVLRMELDGAGTPLAITSTTKIADDLTATFDLATDGDGGIFVSGAGGLYELVEIAAGALPISESVFDPQGFATEVAFHGGGRPFEPFGGPDAGVLAFIPSFNSLSVTLVTPSAPLLQAGDANQDLRFDQFDLVAVQQAGKYLTGEPATWGEGDWSGAPGGTAGSPPVGDGTFDQRDIVSALDAATYLTGPYAAAAPPAGESDSRAWFTYDARSGEVGVDVGTEGRLTSINIESAGELQSVYVPEPTSAVPLACGLVTILILKVRQSRILSRAPDVALTCSVVEAADDRISPDDIQVSLAFVSCPCVVE